MIPLALLVLAAALPVRAQTSMCAAPGPGTSQPSTGTCGLPANQPPEAFKAHIEALFPDLLRASGVDASTILVYKVDDRTRAIDAGQGQGELRRPHPILIWGGNGCPVAKTKDEVLFVMAHELGHLDKKHGTQRARFLVDGFTRWSAKQTPPVPASSPATLNWDDLVKAFGQDNIEAYMESDKTAINEFFSKNESEADRLGYQYLKRLIDPCSAAKAAVTVALQIQDSYWASGKDRQPMTFHPSGRQRSADLLEFIRGSSLAERQCAACLTVP